MTQECGCALTPSVEQGNGNTRFGFSAGPDPNQGYGPGPFRHATTEPIDGTKVRRELPAVIIRYRGCALTPFIVPAH